MIVGRKYTTWAELAHAVRRYKPTELLPVLAISSYSLQENAYSSRRMHYNKWGIAALARESILHGTEFRNQKVTPSVIDKLLYDFGTASFASEVTGKSFQLIVGAFLYEQAKFQLSASQEIARTYLLFCDPNLPVEEEKAPTRNWNDVFGMTLEERLQSIHLIEALTHLKHGIIPFEELKVLEQHPEVQRAEIPNMMRTIDDLTATIQKARDAASEVPEIPSYLKRFSFNPLERFPIIDVGKPALLVPAPFYLLRSLSVGNLYYRACDVWGDKFSSELGYRVEAYVGMQLEHAGFDRLLPEINYGRKSPQLSVDWFAFSGDTVLLIECKSAKLSQHVLSGDPTKTEALLAKTIGKARKQIKNSSDLINDGHEKFSAIPVGMKQIGLIVTAEPVYCANDRAFHTHLADPGIPTFSMSLDDLENLVSLGATGFVDVISKVLDGPSKEAWIVRDAIRKHFPEDGTQPNQLLVEAYERFTAAREQDPDHL